MKIEVNNFYSVFIESNGKTLMTAIVFYLGDSVAKVDVSIESETINEIYFLTTSYYVISDLFGNLDDITETILSEN